MGPDRDAAILQRALDQSEDLPDCAVEVEWNIFRSIILQKRADAADHVARAVCFLDETLEGLSSFCKIWHVVGQPA